MAIPDFQALMLPVLRVSAEGEATVKVCAEAIATEFSLTPADLEARLASGPTRLLHNRIAWVKTHLNAARLTETVRRGVWRATDRGRAVLKEAPARIDMRLLARFPEYAEWRKRPPSGDPRPDPDPEDPVEEKTPLERIDLAAEEILRGLRSELLQAVYAAGPEALEQTTRDLLQRMGYGGQRVGAGRWVGGPGDGGVDVVIDEDALGLGVVCLQSKCYALDRAVQESEVRDFAGALDGRRTKKGVFVTTSRFTDPALRYVEKLGEKKIVLIDGERLAELMIEHGLGVQTARTIVLKRLDGEFFEPEGESGA